jgi:hypothetical protein
MPVTEIEKYHVAGLYFSLFLPVNKTISAT